MMPRRALLLLASAIVAALIVALWQLVSNLHLVSPIFLPPPDRAWAALLFDIDRGGLGGRVLLTLKHMFFGWLLASFGGILIGSAIGISATARAYLAPTLEFFRPLPASALFPVLIAFFGLTENMVLAVIGFGALWPTLLATINGFATVKPRLYEVARLMRLSRRQFILTIALPNAMPEILAGMRLSLTIALILSVTGEILSGSPGLGHWIMLQARSFRIPDLFAGVLLFGLIGYASVQLVSLLEFWLLRWRGR
jgi:ABC-type nitrate/sulfonate/bicarbonate transport system permease component